MKNIKNISVSLAFALVLLIFNSCDDNADLFEITSATAPVLSELSITSIELDPVNTSNPIITLDWKNADYGQQASINYVIQFASDADFTTPVVASSINGNNTITFSVNELNASAGSAGLAPFKWNTLYARIIASIGTQSSNENISNVIQFDVKPYFNYPFKDYYLVGDATAPGWNPNNNNPPLYRDSSNSKKYFYTGYFANGAVKVLETLGLWQPQWGTNDGTSLEVNDGTGSDPGAFSLPSGAGYYAFEMDFGADTFSFTSVDASAATEYTTMSVQGSATASGSTATAINQLAHDKHIWYAKSIHLTPGDLQFITNSSSVWAGTTSFSGEATENGGNIPVVVEDDYDVWFNDLTGRYILIPLNL
jgi:hypothetical protein